MRTRSHGDPASRALRRMKDTSYWRRIKVHPFTSDAQATVAFWALLSSFFTLTVRLACAFIVIDQYRVH
jgi:hypothetical protein